MKRLFKIVGITFACLLATTVVVVAAAVGILCKVVFSPDKLTPVVDKVADQFIGCDYAIDEVDLTLVSTFPNAGLRIKGLYVINPMEGAPSDTVLGIPELILGVDVKQYLDSQKLAIETLSAEDMILNAYINELGDVNWDVLTLEKDTTEEDTSATVLPFDVNVKSIRLSTRQLSFVDKKDSLELSPLSLSLTASATADSTLSSIHAHIDQLLADWNGLTISISGEAGMEEAITMDLHAETNDWTIEHILQTIPEQYAKMMPKEVVADGVLRLTADIAGTYDENTMPLVDAQLTLNNGSGHYDMTILPYELRDLNGDITAHVDLNNKAATCARINKVHARTKNTEIDLQGDITDILRASQDIALGNPLCDLKMKAKIHLQDLEYFVQNDSTNTSLRGDLSGTVSLRSRLEDITTVNVNKLGITADLDINKLDVIWQDSTLAKAESLGIKLTAPRKGVSGKNILSADCELAINNLQAEMPGMNARTQGGNLSAGIEIDTKDTTHIPTLSATFDLKDLIANLDTIHAEALSPKGSASLTNSRRSKTAPKLNAKINAESLNAKMGSEMMASTQKIAIEANANYNAKGQNILTQWNPRLNFDLHQGHAELAMLPLPVDIPQIKFEYSNKNCMIDTSRIVLGNSDFSLSGHIRNIGAWLDNKGELQGTLLFISKKTDVDELLSIVNGLGDSEEDAEIAEATQEPTTQESTDSTESNPFIVPKNVTLILTTHIGEAHAFGQVARNLGGRLYVQDGIAVLEEMGFICEAAKLQLTAMYKSPRRDHLYVGLDYHMLDIDLQQLIAMVPQLDTLVPMLKSLRGQAEFHIAAETYVNDRYELKPSTLRGACSIEGNNLVLLDNETFSTIAKLLMFNKKTENLVDSISAQITLYKDEVTVYPFCLSMDNYMVAVGGNHYLDMTFNYHADVLSPIYLGVDVKGNMDDLKIGLAKCKFAKDFKPLFHRDVDEHAAALRKRISDSLKKSVTIE